MSRILAAIVLIFGLVSFGEAIRCYNCVNCGNSKGTVVDCTSEPGLSRTYCWKATRFGQVHRSCALTNSEVPVSGEECISGNGATFCQCRGNLCNNALPQSSWGVILVLPAIISSLLS